MILVDDYSGFTKLLGEHGFSALVTVRYEGGREYRALLDVGESGRVLLENASTLDVDLRRVDAVVLSHRHHDHSGGLPSIVELLKGGPLIAHPAVMKPCYADSEGFKRLNVGLTPGARRAMHEFEPVLLKTSLELAPDLWFLGEVERHYNNEYAVKDFKTLEDGELVEEPMMDDTGIAIRIGDRVIVVTGCSHSGIPNIVRQARKISRTDEAIIVGGLHLAGAEEETLKKVVEELANEGVVEVHAGHCTGLKGETELLRRYGERMYKIHSGYRTKFKTGV